MSSLTPRVILITGASAGIGRTCAIALSEAFSPLVLILSGRREGELHSTAKECREGTTTEVVAGDVSKEEDVIKMFGLVKEKYGRLDVVFNVSASNEMRIELMRAPYFFSFCLLLLPRAIVCHHKTQNAGVDLLNAVPLEEADMSKFCQVIDVNIMAAVLVSGLPCPKLPHHLHRLCRARGRW